MDLASLKSADTRAIARALTLVENGDAAALASLDALYAKLPRVQRIGVTGPPGAGKSTLVSALIAKFREQNARVAVIAIDPTSPFSGGALLGDRLRMNAHTLDASVFVRSMATRGSFGGLAAATEDACEVLSLAGFDPVIVETVGVGQSEVDVARLADTTVVVLTPGAGDSVQALKAGIMEIADVLAINKADLEGAARLEEDVREALELRGARDWTPPIVRTVATRNEGVTELAAAIGAHRDHLRAKSLLDGNHFKRQEARFDDLVIEILRGSLRREGMPRTLAESLKQRVAKGEISPRNAAAQLVKALNFM